MAIVYLGNATDAAGFRLAGATAFAPKHDAIANAFDQALTQASVVIVAAEVAAQIPAPQLEAALARTKPLVVIASSIDMPAHPLDPAERVRRQLGLET